MSGVRALLFLGTIAAGAVGARDCGGDPIGRTVSTNCSVATRLFVRGQWEGDRDAGSDLTLVLVIERPADVGFLIDDVTVQNGTLISKEPGPPAVIKIDPQGTLRSGNSIVTLGVSCGQSGKVQITAFWGQVDGGRNPPAIITSAFDI